MSRLTREPVLVDGYHWASFTRPLRDRLIAAEITRQDATGSFDSDLEDRIRANGTPGAARLANDLMAAVAEVEERDRVRMADEPKEATAAAHVGCADAVGPTSSD